MIDKIEVEKIVQEYVSDKEIFLVDAKVSASNRITVLADKPGRISIEECVKISKHIEAELDREKEDFELKVSSPGLDMPLQVKEQYEMNIGQWVVIVDNDGESYKGTLSNVTGNGFELETEKKIKGKKKEIVEVSFNFDEIKTVKVIIKFK